ncbi:hypothetical protein OPT61_g5109 [Boeremia exigua]|uniref:Uncharacterized protein n=1 Tax=Boeremia exigua TaxID=749465 RepID=A0ACC2IBG9_9PLEO|nr:hypothetical protein OPT61_g5109 [Boeremia exigua]
MSDYSGPGIYEIVPVSAPGMNLNVWGGAQTPGTQLKLYPRTSSGRNTQFAIVASGGTQGKPEKGDREYLLIAVNSGLYIASNDDALVTTELRSPTDGTIRWRLQHAGNGAFYINNAGTGKQLNVRGGAKETGTEIIVYSPTEAGNSQFFLKAV